MTEEIETLYSTEEVANILKINVRLVHRYLRSGKLKGVKIGKYYRIKESNVKKLIETGHND